MSEERGTIPKPKPIELGAVNRK